VSKTSRSGMQNKVILVYQKKRWYYLVCVWAVGTNPFASGYVSWPASGFASICASCKCVTRV